MVVQSAVSPVIRGCVKVLWMLKNSFPRNSQKQNRKRQEPVSVPWWDNNFRVVVPVLSVPALPLSKLGIKVAVSPSARGSVLEKCLGVATRLAHCPVQYGTYEFPFSGCVHAPRSFGNLSASPRFHAEYSLAASGCRLR